MTERERKALFTNIYNKYSREMWIHEGDPGRGNGACAYIMRREIILPEGTLENPDEWDILALLHEIGHIKTNHPKMKTYEKEYFATQWSADEAKKIGLNVKDSWKNVFQDHIWKKRDLSIKMKGKNVASKESMVVKW